MQDILLLNLRAEPVLFLRQGTDMIPYAACTSERLYNTNDALTAVSGLTVTEVEVALRKEARYHDTINLLDPSVIRWLHFECSVP